VWLGSEGDDARAASRPVQDAPAADLLGGASVDALLSRGSCQPASSAARRRFPAVRLSWRSLDGLRKREKASGASTWGHHRTHLGSVLVSSVVLVISRSLHVACSAYGSEVDKERALGEQRVSGRLESGSNATISICRSTMPFQHLPPTPQAPSNKTSSPPLDGHHLRPTRPLQLSPPRPSVPVGRNRLALRVLGDRPACSGDTAAL
jgi:hypothetical protein